MSIANSMRATRVAASAGQTVLPATFPLVDAAYLSVVRLPLGGTPAVVTAYTLQSITDTSFEVVLSSGATAGDIYSIATTRPIERSTDFIVAQNPKTPMLNSQLDEAMRIIQELRRDVSRAISLSLTDERAGLVMPPLARDKYLYVNAVGALEGRDAQGPAGPMGATGIQSVATIAALRNLAPAVQPVIWVMGRASASDGGAGMFYWSSANLSAKVTADPQRLVYVAPLTYPAGDQGAWVRVYDGRLSPLWAGAVGDNTTDDRAAWQATIDLARVTYDEIYMPARTFRIGGSLLYYDDTKIIGAGRNSVFRGPSLTVPLLRSDAWNQARRFRPVFAHFAIDNASRAAAGAVGLDLRNVSQAMVQGLHILNCDTGLQIYADANPPGSPLPAGSLGAFYNVSLATSISSCNTGYYCGENAASGGSNANTLAKSRINDVTNGVVQSAGSSNSFDDIKVETFTALGIDISNASYDTRVENARIEDSAAGYPYRIAANCVRTCLRNIQITSCPVPGSDLAATTVMLDGDQGLKFGGGTRVKRMQKTQAVLNFGSVPANDSVDRIVNITGATIDTGHLVTGPPSLPVRLSVSNYSVANGCVVRLTNVSTAAATAVNATFTVWSFVD